MRIERLITFGCARGYVAGHVESRLVLDLPVSDFRLAGLEVPAPDYRTLSFDGPLPAKWLAALADLVNGMATDVPTGDLDLEAARWEAARVAENQHPSCAVGYALVITLVIDRAGTTVSYTEMLVSGDGLHQRTPTCGRRTAAIGSAPWRRPVTCAHSPRRTRAPGTCTRGRPR
jgi:hypothetical protein